MFEFGDDPTLGARGVELSLCHAESNDLRVASFAARALGVVPQPGLFHGPDDGRNGSRRDQGAHDGLGEAVACVVLPPDEGEAETKGGDAGEEPPGARFGERSAAVAMPIGAVSVVLL